MLRRFGSTPYAVLLGMLCAGCGGGEADTRALDQVEPDVGDAPWDPPAEQCAPVDPDAPETFTECSHGSGSFGRWFVDDGGLPAYRYGMDQHADDRALWDTTEVVPETGEPVERRDHWVQLGNDRINAMVSNDGTVEVVTQDRGVEYLNKLDASREWHAGGFSYVHDGERGWATAYAHRPEGAATDRVFGTGYARAETQFRDVRVKRTVIAPPGDAPFVISEVVIENRGRAAKNLAHYEYWDVARRSIEINWAVSGDPLTLAPSNARRQRDERNALFEEAVSYDPGAALLSVARRHAPGVAPPPASEPSAIDYYPPEPFLAALVGEVSDVFVDEAAFFGDGGPALPDAVRDRASGPGTGGGELEPHADAFPQDNALVLKSDVTVPPGESVRLRFAYGYAPFGEQPSGLDVWRDAARDPLAEARAHWRSRLPYFAPDRDPVLHRELAWHQYQLEASIGQREYFETRVVPQGSAYLYLHGADGAARDLGLFAAPLVFTNPELAKDVLELYMRIQFADDDRFSYAFQGHGMLDDAGIHKAPSDLPINFLWALSEYLGATGDLAWLDQTVPFHPKEARPDATVWDHLEGAVRHLFDVVGTGEHGLIRVQTGDWSDGIVASEAPDRELAEEEGESIPNTQMAIAILPLVADLIQPRDEALATEIRTKVEAYRTALEPQFEGRFFYRAYFGDGEPAWKDSINLESQVWALIGNTFARDEDRVSLVGHIAEKLDDPSPVGAPLWSGGQVWPAISGLLTWGYARSAPERAWGHLVRNTLASHATAFPEVWHGIWSGPDGFSSKSGNSWKSVVTPMTDFPVQNNNYHALPLLAALRVAGLEPTATGIRIAPRVPGRTFTLKTTLCDLEQRGSQLSGVYRPPSTAPRTVVVEAGEGGTITSLVVNDQPLNVPTDASSVSFAVPAGEAARFEVATAQ